MLILFDHGTPVGLEVGLAGHRISTARSQGWEQLSNGDLLRAAEEAGFEMLLTTDQGIRYQQNLTGRSIAIVVLSGTTKWSQVRLHVEHIVATVNAAEPGSYAEIFIPYPRR